VLKPVCQIKTKDLKENIRWVVKFDESNVLSETILWPNPDKRFKIKVKMKSDGQEEEDAALVDTRASVTGLGPRFLPLANKSLPFNGQQFVGAQKTLFEPQKDTELILLDLKSQFKALITKSRESNILLGTDWFLKVTSNLCF
jgi:hypothetical protein